MNQEYIEISTKQGKLKGLVKKSTGLAKRTFYSFQGIPYAQPPVGNLRFKAPKPYGQWEGIWDATKEGNSPLQQHMLFRNWIGDEDCLYLNVFTTQLPEKKAAKQAVMVWIHGGGFSRGSGSSDLYGPDFLVEEDIVLVTINYRCGVLGFLSLENDKVPGNAGLKDQTLALHWVQENIHSFGGDPNNVTIFGESAGGASVNYHMLSPLSKGGFAVCQWAFQSKPKQKALLFAQELGCTSQDLDKVLEFFMSLTADDLVKAQYKETIPTQKEKIQMSSLMFLPCVDVAGEDPFLPDYPRKMMERGEFTQVPVMMGVNNKEGLLALATKAVNFERVNADPSVMVPNDLNIESGSEEEQKLGKEILKFYTDKKTLTWDNVQGYVNFKSDVGFVIGLDNFRLCVLKHNTAGVYNYQYTYTSPRSYSFFTLPMAYPDKAAEFVGSGASHGDELALLFETNLDQVPYILPTADDQAFMSKFLKAWTSFAKTGNPNCKALGITWEQDNINTPHFLELGKVWETVDNTIFPKRTEFWKRIYKKYSYSY